MKHLQMNQFGKQKNEEMQSYIVVFPSESLLFSQLATSGPQGKNLIYWNCIQLWLLSLDLCWTTWAFPPHSSCVCL